MKFSIKNFRNSSFYCLGNETNATNINEIPMNLSDHVSPAFARFMQLCRMSHGVALLLLLGVFVLHFSRILFLREVIFPHDNAIEAGAVGEQVSPGISNRKFSDQSDAFIPELAGNLGSNRKAWLDTWNPHVQLGRASYHLSGLSRAFPLTNLLSCFTSNPFVVYTALVLLTVGLTAGFLLLFLRSLGLHPGACACAALGLGFTTPVSYWLCFVMFLAAFCWSVCLLWLITEFTRKPSWAAALGLAFATYCLLMTAYPQLTILSLYMIGAYTLIRLLQMPRTGREKLRTMLAMLGCAAAGALAALPVYLDLLLAAKDSARLGEVTDSFFLGVLPPSRDLREMAGFLMTLFDWSWLGNAIDPKYPVHFNGLSFTPVYGSLIWLSFILKNRRVVWLWQLLLIACLAATIFPAVYLFAVHHLGFGLSRAQLLAGGIVPGFILSAFTIDAILRGELRLTIRSAAWLLIPVAAESVVALLVWRPLPIDPFAVAATFLLVTALLGSIHRRSIPALIAVAVVSTFLYGRTLILSRSPQTIHLSSKLIDAIKTKAPDGKRFAIADRTMAVLPANQETLFGLESVNSYDSLSSRRYQELMGHWGAVGASTYGRHFKFVDIGRALADPAFPFSNVHLILSTRPLATDQLTLAAEVNEVKLYQTATPPIGMLQTPRFQLSNAGEAAIDPLAARPNLESHRVETLTDFQKIEVTASPQETLLFLSQQYHRAWRAEAHHRSLRTVIVNRFYQGVLLPPNTSEVELSFRPFVLWSWLPQLLFAVSGALLLLRAALHIRRDPSASAA
jgi:hypothetical protein